MQFPITEKFTLSEGFLEKYKTLNPGWDALGEFVFMRTYSRLKSDGTNEAWWETVRRVVEGIYTIQKQHITDYRLGWNQAKAQRSAQEMYDRIFKLKMLGSGRALWSMGADVIMEKGMAEALYNCSFLSTEDMKNDPGLPFANAMDFLMLGVGVGFDTRGAGTIIVQGQKEKEHVYVIPDTREGWVESTRLAINSFFGGLKYVFDYSQIRPAGMPIRTFGGVSAGSEPLERLHNGIVETLSHEIGKPVSITAITNIINMVGVAVVSGNVRRSAEIVLGDGSEEFLDLKNYYLNPKRMAYGWASNNSVAAELGMDYSKIAEKIANNGEPGVVFLENFRAYGRVRATEKNFKDNRIMGLNPCAEIGLEPSELCNLVETFPDKHESLDDYLVTLKYAYLFAKTVTLLNTHWPETNRVMLRNRRIGLSMSGIAQFICNRGLKELKEWMHKGYDILEHYDKVYSEWFAIPLSIKMTTIKPSGTLSLLAGATPGIHFPESNYYIRRVRLAKNSPFVSVLEKAYYKLEPASEDQQNTLVVEFPVCLGDRVRTLNDVSMWEQLNIAAFAQEHWADNSVSVTVTFKEEEKKDIAHALDIYQFKTKALSFLPKLEGGAYPQMPYESITKEKYQEMMESVLPLDFSHLTVQSIGEQYCSNDTCAI